MSISILEQYWSGVLKRLQAEVDTFNRLIAHQGTMGTENEVSLARVLERLVPGRYGIGSGLLIDRHGNSSKQMDIVVFDQTDEPALMAQTNQVLFPVENVRFCIEVKTTANKEEIEDAEEKRQSIHKLFCPIEHPALALVAYQAGQRLETIARHLSDGVANGRTDRLDLALILDQAVIAGRCELLPTLCGAESATLDDFVVGIAPLQTLKGKEPQIGQYVRPMNTSSHEEVIGTSSYTVCDTADGELLADSSRALLLFCEAMLSYLARQDGRTSILSEYLTPAGRDILLLSEESTET